MTVSKPPYPTRPTQTPSRTQRYLAFQAHLHRHLRALGLNYHLHPPSMSVPATTFLTTLPVAKSLVIVVLELHFPELGTFHSSSEEFVDELLIRIVVAIREQVGPHTPRSEVEHLLERRNREEDIDLLGHIADPHCARFGQ